MAHVQELREDLVFMHGNESQLVLPEVDGNGIGVMPVVLLAHEVKSCSDLEVPECQASFGVHESSDVGVEEVLPLLCSLFHNHEC